MPWLFWFLAVPVVALLILHATAPAVRARKHASSTLRAFCALQADLRQEQESVKVAVAQAASGYVQDMLAERLRNTPLSELGKARSGARLQPLKDAGITNIAQLQGWSVDRLMQLKGVGEVSAKIIVELVGKQCAERKSQPVPYPAKPFNQGAERQVVHAIYIDPFRSSMLTSIFLTSRCSGQMAGSWTLKSMERSTTETGTESLFGGISSGIFGLLKWDGMF